MGVNDIGLEAANPTMCNGRDLPWLQATAERDVWEEWGVVYRDVRILDRRNELFAVYNVTTNDLEVAANRAELEGLLRDAANAP